MTKTNFIGNNAENEITAPHRQALSRHGYRALRLIGRGAFSQVLLIQQEETKLLFACKISSRRDLARREGAILKAAVHPLFPKFRDLWEDGGSAFLVMEYVCGSSLEEFLHRRGFFSSVQTARVGMELAEGLKFLHQLPEPVLYRDLKPANIMIRQDGRVKLLDMGCACGLRQPDGARAGTPGYAAPEQLESGGVLSFATDVYGLGKTLEDMIRNSRDNKNNRDHRDNSLRQVITACTAAQPDQRIPDMQGVMTALAFLCRSGESRGELSRIKGFLQSRVSCVKSVWESEYKNI